MQENQFLWHTEDEVQGDIVQTDPSSEVKCSERLSQKRREDLVTTLGYPLRTREVGLYESGGRAQSHAETLRGNTDKQFGDGEPEQQQQQQQ